MTGAGTIPYAMSTNDEMIRELIKNALFQCSMKN